MNKKGFTLIELLAVIVILAIIMVIAVPQILNVIEGSRRNAALSSTLLYVRAIEYDNKFALMGQSGYTRITSGNVSDINVNIKGEGPTSGSVTINEAGKVSSASLCIQGYTVNYDGSSATIGDKCSGNEQQGGGSSNASYYYSTAYYSIALAESVSVDFESQVTTPDDDWPYYLRKNTTTDDLDVCKVFPSGTVCVTTSNYNSSYSNVDGYTSDFEDCSSGGTGIFTNSNINNSCLKGYAKEKAVEMISKGASECHVNEGQVYCTDNTGVCYVNTTDITCGGSGYECGIVEDSGFCY